MTAPGYAPTEPKRPTFILGIDPGLTGALAFYEPHTGDLIIADVPTVNVRENRVIKSKPDIYSLGILLDAWRPMVEFAVIEKVNAMPKQGITSAFNFGDVFGVLRGAVGANLIPLHLVQPADWKKTLQLKGGKENKDEARQAASHKLPRHTDKWPLKKHHNRAEAALLAWYGHKYLRR